MNNYVFSDLACERENGQNCITHIISRDIKKAVSLSNAPTGNKNRHVTFFTPKLWLMDDATFVKLQKEIAFEISKMLRGENNFKAEKNISVLVVGLGNPHLTPDALGAETVKMITVNRHTVRENNAPCISAITPDVMGNTGIDTVDAVEAYVSVTKPSAIIAVDSLMARSYERLASTVQISNAGVSPGSGIALKKRAIDYKTFGVPVISIGVPMAINSSTLISEAVAKGGISEPTDNFIELLENSLNFIVTPKETDILLRSASLLLSSSIDRAMLYLNSNSF